MECCKWNVFLCFIELQLIKTNQIGQKMLKKNNKMPSLPQTLQGSSEFLLFLWLSAAKWFVNALEAGLTSKVFEGKIKTPKADKEKVNKNKRDDKRGEEKQIQNSRGG